MLQQSPRKPRARELGLDFEGEAGPFNALTDVPGVLVGTSTLIDDARPSGRPVRTGVTTVLPHGLDRALRPVWAGFHALNGNGEVTGVHWIRHAGHFCGPICLTNTHSVGMMHHAVTGWMIEHFSDEFRQKHLWALPVVAETYDGVLNDINGQHLRPEHLRESIAEARSGPMPEGNVGGGTGMIAYEFKGGTGTASQVVELGGAKFTLGVLVQANHGLRDWLTISGVPVGRFMRDDLLHAREQGSIIAVIGTDAPLLPGQLERIASRAALGIGRHGTPGGNSSGDMFLAFSTANPVSRAAFAGARRTMDCVPDEWLDPLYLATVRATDEAVVNAMLAAESMSTVKPAGKTCRAIDHDILLDILGRHGRLR
ncbi:MAG TPA: P1 family peptidase [Mesorhizobium sp.]|jgi:D-aminopeptidase|nr:P1 family peptidase [Mesorhizobium sp.]